MENVNNAGHLREISPRVTSRSEWCFRVVRHSDVKRLIFITSNDALKDKKSIKER